MRCVSGRPALTPASGFALLLANIITPSVEATPGADAIQDSPHAAASQETEPVEDRQLTEWRPQLTLFDLLGETGLREVRSASTAEETPAAAVTQDKIDVPPAPVGEPEMTSEKRVEAEHVVPEVMKAVPITYDADPDLEDYQIKAAAMRVAKGIAGRELARSDQAPNSPAKTVDEALSMVSNLVHRQALIDCMGSDVEARLLSEHASEAGSINPFIKAVLDDQQHDFDLGRGHFARPPG